MEFILTNFYYTLFHGKINKKNLRSLPLLLLSPNKNFFKVIAEFSYETK